LSVQRCMNRYSERLDSVRAWLCTHPRWGEGWACLASCTSVLIASKRDQFSRASHILNDVIDGYHKPQADSQTRRKGSDRKEPNDDRPEGPTHAAKAPWSSKSRVLLICRITMRASGIAFLCFAVLLGLVGLPAVEGWTSYLQSLSPSTAPLSYPSTQTAEEEAPPGIQKVVQEQGDYLSYLSSP
jgi:hypothetical protein